MRYPFLLLFLFVCLAPLSAQVTPAEAVAAMGRGINLGNSLEPPSETAWGNPPAREELFDAYVEAGFTNVRIPVKWDQRTGTTPPYTINPDWLDRVEEVVDWGLDRGLWITINGHHEDWLKGRNGDYSQANRNRYDAIWRQISERFGGKSERLLYEIINEPVGLTQSQVHDLNVRILGIIRENEPTRLVIFGGNMYSNAEQLASIPVPDPADDYLIGYYHSYDPWPFAGEGNGTWGSPGDYAAMRNKFNIAVNWTNQTGIPVHVSEFNARVEGDFNSRMRWLAEYVGLAQQHGFAFSVWDDGGWFRVMNRNNYTWPETKDIFVHYHEDSPHRIEVRTQTENDQLGVELSWTNRASATGDILIERRSSAGAFTTIGSVAADTERYFDAEVNEGVTYDYRIRTTYPDGTPLHGYPQRLTVAAGTGGGDGTQSAFGTTNAIPGIVEIEDYDNGGEGVAYHDTDAANLGGGYRLNEGVDIGGGPDNGFVLGYVATGEWIEYTVEVATSGTYEVRTSVASADNPSNFSVSFPDGAATSFSTPVTGDWNAYRPLTAGQDITLEAGTQVLRVDITGSGAFNIDHLEFILKSTATEAESVRAGFTLTPNPAADWVRVELPAALRLPNTVLTLTTVSGQVVRSWKQPASADTLSVADLVAGTYLLRATDGERSFVRRLLKQ